MENYFIILNLLTLKYLGCAQEIKPSTPANTSMFDLTVKNDSYKEEDDIYLKNISSTSLEATQNGTEVYNKSTDEQSINTQDPEIENGTEKYLIQIFDMETKQNISVDLADILQDDDSDIEILDTDDQNTTAANRRMNETVSSINKIPTKIFPTHYVAQNKIVDADSNTSMKKDNNTKSSSTLPTNNTRTSNRKVAEDEDSKDQLDNFEVNCGPFKGKVCSRIAKLRTFSCDDGTVIPIKKLCNAQKDCSNGKDEENCPKQVIDKCESVRRVLSAVESFKECQPDIMKQYSFTANLMNYQKILHEIGGFNISIQFGDFTEMIDAMLDLINFDLCIPFDFYDKIKEDFTKIEVKVESLTANNFVTPHVDWNPADCSCNYQFCKEIQCDNRCRRVCWQLYVLDHYMCMSVTGAMTIPLDYLCDGKIDCIDDSDETSCMIETTSYKHKANVHYNNLLERLSSTVAPVTFDQHKIKKIKDVVSLLHLLTVKTPEPNINIIKMLRDKYFKMLVKMFKKLFGTIKVLREINLAHDFLLTLNQMMIKALKSSHTGNKYVASSADCYCRNGLCISLVCAPRCTEYCLAKSVITQYKCNNTLYVSLNKLCDGNKDCEKGQDEEDCSHKSCSTREFYQLRHTLGKVEKLLSDVLLRKVFKDWKRKITQIITTPGSAGSNRESLEDKVNLILAELLDAYSIVKAQLPWTDIRTFIAISEIIKQSLKSCSK